MKVTPRTKEKTMVDYSTLKYGDAFLWNGDVWIKGKQDQAAVNLRTGEMFFNTCGEYIVPVEATINWKHKVSKKKGKK